MACCGNDSPWSLKCLMYREVQYMLGRLCLYEVCNIAKEVDVYHITWKLLISCF